MKLSHRAMQPEDIRECVDIVAHHPFIGPRYGPAIDLLPQALLRLGQCEAQTSIVFLAGEGLRTAVCAVGIIAIVRDDFVREMKTPPHFWAGPALAMKIVSGESPVLTGKQLQEANSRGGLNLICWETCYNPAYAAHGELHRYTMSAFIKENSGYLWKEVICQPDGPEHLEFCLNTGGYLWDSKAGAYADSPNRDVNEILRKPHIVGTTRELERQRSAGSWVGGLFDYHPPRLGFSRSEQRLLSCALPGETDERLAGMLGISLPAVKKMWASIYRRVQDGLPELISDPLRSDISAGGRGREKRRVLLAYLREHPEELRPISRKVLAEAARG